MNGFIPPVFAIPARIQEISNRFGSATTSLGSAADALVFGQLKHDAELSPEHRSLTMYSSSGDAPVRSSGGPTFRGTTVVKPDGSLADGVPYADLFRRAGAAHGIRPSVLAAVAKVESAFNADAVSPAGARGLMQFMPATAAAMGVDPYDPASAIDGAARYLSSNLRRFGSLELALAAYNAGPGAVAKAGGIPPIAETQNYVPAVMGLLGNHSGGSDR